jgi:flagellar biosynthetic protein FliP
VRPKDLQLFEELDASRAAKAKAAENGGAAIPALPAPALSSPIAAQAAEKPDAAAKPVDLRVLIPAFMVSELRRAFEIGFLIVLPFLIIDIVVGTLVMSMGMMMMPPVVLALPFKILFFILIDGWNLLVGGLVQSYF